MVVDTSAVVAILFGEPERAALTTVLAEADTRLISAATLVETGIVVEARKGERGRAELDLFVHEAGLEVIAFDGAQADMARLAWRLFGKGRHEAALNMGDCYSYALAKTSGQPLLFKGADFAKMDIDAA